jgi:hypothetical protein
MAAENQIKTAQKEIKALRKRRLEEGLTFMINSESLPKCQCYLEFPDGLIVIAKANSKESDFEIIEELDGFEINKLRKELNLI